MPAKLMRHRLLTTTAVLSVALGTLPPLPLMAQDTPPPQTTAPEAADPQAPAAGSAPTETAPAEAPEIPPASGDTGTPIPAPAETEEPETEAPQDAAPAEVTPEAPTTPAETEAPPPAPEAEAPETPAAPEPEAAPTTQPETTGSEAAEPEATEPEAPRPEATEPGVTPEAGPDTAAPTESEAPAPRPEAEADAPDAQPEPDADTPAPAAEAPATDNQADAQPEDGAVESLNGLLGGTAATDDAAPPTAAAATADNAEATAETTTEITETDARSSGEDFATTASGERRDDDDDDDGLSNLQKAGLLALGGLAVGALMNNGSQVEANTGDRVVLRQNDGQYVVLKDDDALLRQPGSTVRTENFSDGSTRSIISYDDGSRVETIRDASGRVLRRARIAPDGTQTRLIDDTAQVAPVDVSTLPTTREDVRVSATDRTGLRDALARIEARDNARAYSLAQIRDYRQVRALAPVVDVDNITFRTGSAAVEASQAEQLSDLGNLLRDLIDDNPREVFLIEGHTDAVGSAVSNLALSDRRAESVALALTEYFDVPPENMVVQGYGESDLRIDSDADEPRNRRVAVRIITPLLQASAQ